MNGIEKITARIKKDAGTEAEAIRREGEERAASIRAGYKAQAEENAKAAAQLANALRPKAAVPYHYGSVVGSEKDAREFIALLDPAIEGKLLLEE